MSLDDRWIVWPRGSNPRAAATLIVIPHAGAGAGMFVPWAKWTDPRIRLGIVRLPGRESRWSETPIRSMEALLPALAQSVADVHGDVAIFGHCLGATIGFEIAQELSQHATNRPCILFASGSVPPDSEERGPSLSTLPDDALVQVLRRQGGTPESVLQNHELLELLLPSIRADFAVQESYRYYQRPRLACPILALCGERDRDAGPTIVNGWAVYTLAQFQVFSFPGDHFFIWQHQEKIMQVVCQRTLEAIA